MNYEVADGIPSPNRKCNTNLIKTLHTAQSYTFSIKQMNLLTVSHGTRQAYRQADRGTDTNKQRHSHTSRHPYKQTTAQPHKQASIQASNDTAIQAGIHTSKQRHGHTSRLPYKQGQLERKGYGMLEIGIQLTEREQKGNVNSWKNRKLKIGVGEERVQVGKWCAEEE